jgi:riboflavin synthase alpha subunit
MTNLHRLKPGDGMNLEFDVIAKYVERMIAGGAIEAKESKSQEFKKNK